MQLFYCNATILRPFSLRSLDAYMKDAWPDSYRSAARTIPHTINIANPPRRKPSDTRDHL